MVPGGYIWWYLDGVSDDGRHGLTIIAFIGSVFSPYYAWAGRRDPHNHVCLNVALYGPRGRWAMTERGRGALAQSESRLAIGPSALEWRDDGLVLDIQETAVPLPRPIRGQVRLKPAAMTERGFEIDSRGRHRWWPIAPVSRIQVELSQPSLIWSGPAYLDTNAGDEPLEDGFVSWNWARASLRQGAAIAYDAVRRDGSEASLGLIAEPSGALREVELPPAAAIPSGLWGVRRAARADEGQLTLRKTLEDAPFYTRSLLTGQLFGEDFTAVHESLDLDRFANPVVKLMLPFRMPRRRR